MKGISLRRQPHAGEPPAYRRSVMRRTTTGVLLTAVVLSSLAFVTFDVAALLWGPSHSPGWRSNNRPQEQVDPDDEIRHALDGFLPDGDLTGITGWDQLSDRHNRDEILRQLEAIRRRQGSSDDGRQKNIKGWDNLSPDIRREILRRLEAMRPEQGVSERRAAFNRQLAEVMAEIREGDLAMRRIFDAVYRAQLRQSNPVIVDLLERKQQSQADGFKTPPAMSKSEMEWSLMGTAGLYDWYKEGMKGDPPGLLYGSGAGRRDARSLAELVVSNRFNSISDDEDELEENYRKSEDEPPESVAQRRRARMGLILYGLYRRTYTDVLAKGSSDSGAHREAMRVLQRDETVRGLAGDEDWPVYERAWRELVQKDVKHPWLR